MKKITVALILSMCMMIFSFSIRIDPILISKVVGQGEKTSASIFIENADEFETVNFEVTVMDVVQNREGGYVVAPAGSTDYSAAKWTKVTPTKFSVQPKKTARVDVEINVPRGVIGGRYAAVVLKIVTKKEELTGMEEAAGFGVLLDYQIASFIELNIDSLRKRPELYVTGLSLRKISEIPSLAEVQNIIGPNANVFAVTVLNKGNMHVQAYGELIIKTKDNRTLAKFPMGSGNILPGAEVELRSITTRQFPEGSYIARAVVNYGGYRPAILEAELNIVKDEAVSKTQKQSEAPLIFVEPGNIELKCLPGAFRSTTVEIFNRGNQTVNISASVYPLVYDLEGELVPTETRGQAPSWIEISPTSFQLRPNQSRKLRISVRPSEGVKGGQYFDLSFVATAEDLKSEQGANLLVFVGKDEEMIQRASMQFTKVVPTEEGLEVDLLVNNEGNTHFLPSISVGLERIIPEREENGIIYPESTERIVSASYANDNPILAGTQRLFMLALNVDLKSGEYVLIARLDAKDLEQVVIKERIRIERGEER
jgi:P pilus assembly chaperone PapD